MGYIQMKTPVRDTMTIRIFDEDDEEACIEIGYGRLLGICSFYDCYACGLERIKI